jgi:hypothetical protein
MIPLILNYRWMQLQPRRLVIYSDGLSRLHPIYILRKMR